MVAQLEGIHQVRDMLRKTPYWGFVDTPYGRMFIGGNDDGIALRYHNSYVYEPVSLALWMYCCRGAAVVVDVGAHTGIYSLAANKAGAKVVVSIEPYYLNAARLMLNLHANGYPVQHVAVMGASYQDGISKLHVPMPPGAEPYCTTASNVYRAKDQRQFVMHVRRLDTLLPDVQATALKIDAEYHTGPILDGAPHLLQQKPELILESFETGLTKRLAPLGYRFWLIDERTGLHEVETLEPQKPDAYCRNYFASVRPAPLI